MPNLTPPIAQGFDAKRRVLLGPNVTLALLNHKGPGLGGYSKLKDVPSGWFLQVGGNDEPAVLEIAETEEITLELIKKAVAYSVSGKVWKRVANDFESPLGETIRVWRIRVKPTAEKFFD